MRINAEDKTFVDLYGCSLAVRRKYDEGINLTMASRGKKNSTYRSFDLFVLYSL